MGRPKRRRTGEGDGGAEQAGECTPTGKEVRERERVNDPGMGEGAGTDRGCGDAKPTLIREERRSRD